MKLGDKLKALKSLYSVIPVKENLITEGNYYIVVEMYDDYFTVFDDTNHSRSFYNIEYNDMFVNFTEDLESLLRQLEVCVKLNKDIPIRVYDYIINRYKSFKRHYIDTPESFNTKQLVGVSFDGVYYKVSLTAKEMLELLKEKYKD